MLCMRKYLINMSSSLINSGFIEQSTTPITTLTPTKNYITKHNTLPPNTTNQTTCTKFFRFNV